MPHRAGVKVFVRQCKSYFGFVWMCAGGLIFECASQEEAGELVFKVITNDGVRQHMMWCAFK